MINSALVRFQCSSTSACSPHNNEVAFCFFSFSLQLLEAAWCLTNIAAGGSEQTRSLLPALPLLIAHLGG